MAAFLADECLPSLIVMALREAGHDVRYAAETDHRAADHELVAIANGEQRVIVTEDFDFGELLVRHGLTAPGAIVLFLPNLDADARRSRLMHVLGSEGFQPLGRLTIISARRVRQRNLGG